MSRNRNAQTLLIIKFQNTHTQKKQWFSEMLHVVMRTNHVPDHRRRKTSDKNQGGVSHTSTTANFVPNSWFYIYEKLRLIELLEFWNDGICPKPLIRILIAWRSLSLGPILKNKQRPRLYRSYNQIRKNKDKTSWNVKLFLSDFASSVGTSRLRDVWNRAETRESRERDNQQSSFLALRSVTPG